MELSYSERKRNPRTGFHSHVLEFSTVRRRKLELVNKDLFQRVLPQQVLCPGSKSLIHLK